MEFKKGRRRQPQSGSSRRMHLMSAYVGVLLYIIQYKSLALGSGFPSDTIAFNSDTCQYGNRFFTTSYYPEQECKKITCNAATKTLTIESCPPTTSNDPICTLKSNPGEESKKFPFCCDKYTCRNKGKNLRCVIFSCTASNTHGSKSTWNTFPDDEMFRHTTQLSEFQAIDAWIKDLQDWRFLSRKS
ncbi:hypothetical protein V5799_007221 [Amblyomma americanum]|uniref:Single domain-containing protein n=1 Tax=Amblyomma americanum TaxID=6943 RepID=A0AAQ4DU59_AMBAM